MPRETVELTALGFQAVVTALLAAVYFGLWRQQRRPHFATWGVAWALYAARLALISAFLVDRRDAWLFAHQAATGITALLLLLAALQFSRGVRWRPRYAWFAAFPLAWAYASIFVVRDPAVAGLSTAALLSSVTLWTGLVFWRHGRRTPSAAAAALAATFALWGLHHLDYPLLRPLGSGVLFGVLADVVFIVAAALGTLFLVVGEGRRALEARRTQLEQLSRLLLRAQEDERRRIARELHDEAGQVLTALKIELDLEGRAGASALVARALSQLRDLSNLLRPTVLDDLGLLPALRALVDDFGRRTAIAATLDAPETTESIGAEREVVLYRVVQEALTNVARHAGARRVAVRLRSASDAVRLVVEDDGRGHAGDVTPNLGILGMRERVAALGGSIVFESSPGTGFRLEALLPREAA